jgi:2'-5' RNA ligase
LLFAKIISNIVFSNSLIMTGYYDYLIVLSPSENVVTRVKKLKNFGVQKIGEYDEFNTKANIVVQYWPRKKPLWVEPMIPKLERELQLLPSPVLDVNGFDFFNQQHNKTIYAKIKGSSLTEVWFKYLRKYFNARAFEPHITIAKSITDESFKTLWQGFKNLEWDERFAVDKLVILKRETIGYDKSYKVFKEIYFNKDLDFEAFAGSKIRPIKPVSRAGALQISLF